MDIATLIGIVVGFGLIAFAILLDGPIGAFINGPGLLVVVGGTIAATLIKARLGQVIGAFSVAMNAFLDRTVPLDETIETLEEMVVLARKDGLLALENISITDPFLARATLMVIDGLEREFVISSLRCELATVKGRHERGHLIFRFMCSTAPAMGMIGTLIGLVNMLQALDDPSAIGPAMAVALLTTFYGAVLAFLIFGPMAEKLESRSAEEQLRGKLVIVGIDSVISGDNKQATQARLDAFLSPGEREAAKGKEKEAPADG